MDNNKHDAQSPESQATSILTSSVSNDDVAAKGAAPEPQVIKAEAQEIKHQEAKPEPQIAKSATVSRQVTQVNRSSWAIRFGVLLALGLTASTLAGGYLLYQHMQQQIQLQAAQNIALQDQLQQALIVPNQRIAQLEQQQLSDTKTFQELSKL
ncbi:MAG: uroporphyrinogen-III C-methyltransferase, partial [Shewanella sp.]